MPGQAGHDYIDITKFGFIDETQAGHCRAFLVWQDSCIYIQKTTILTDEEQTDAFH